MAPRRHPFVPLSEPWDMSKALPPREANPGLRAQRFGTRRRPQTTLELVAVARLELAIFPV